MSPLLGICKYHRHHLFAHWCLVVGLRLDAGVSFVDHHGKQFAPSASQAITCHQRSSECDTQSVPRNPLSNPLEITKRWGWCTRSTTAVGRKENSRLLLESYTCQTKGRRKTRSRLGEAHLERSAKNQPLFIINTMLTPEILGEIVSTRDEQIRGGLKYLWKVLDEKSVPPPVPKQRA